MELVSSNQICRNGGVLRDCVDDVVHIALGFPRPVGFSGLGAEFVDALLGSRDTC